MTAAQTLTGKIVRMTPDRGFFFIKSDQDQQDYFAHYSQLQDGVTIQTLKVGDRMRFTPTDNGKGPRAADVTLITGNM